MYEYDRRIVLTLDAGGTNFVFGAVQSCQEIIEPYKLPAEPNDLNLCIQTLVKGFSAVKSQLPEDPVAISFAFPGPADYEHGVIGDLPNLPAFRGGIALGPYLSHHFGIPVYLTFPVSSVHTVHISHKVQIFYTCHKIVQIGIVG